MTTSAFTFGQIHLWLWGVISVNKFGKLDSTNWSSVNWFGSWSSVNWLRSTDSGIGIRSTGFGKWEFGKRDFGKLIREFVFGQLDSVNWNSTNRHSVNWFGKLTVWNCPFGQQSYNRNFHATGVKLRILKLGWPDFLSQNIGLFKFDISFGQTRQIIWNMTYQWPRNVIKNAGTVTIKLGESRKLCLQKSRAPLLKSWIGNECDICNKVKGQDKHCSTAVKSLELWVLCHYRHSRGNAEAQQF